MCNYNKLFKYVFKNWGCPEKIKEFDLKYKMGGEEDSPRMTPCVLGWGQENGLVNKDNVVLIPSQHGGYQEHVVNVDPFTLKCYELFTPWYKKLWKLTCESCGKYWIPIILGSATYNMLYDYLPIIISWIL